MKVNDEFAIVSLYNENTCNTRDISERFNMSSTKLFSILKKHNVPKREHKVFNRKPYSTEAKIKISETMKKVHAEGKHPGWTAVNSKKEDSYPEKTLLQYMKASTYLSQYTILPKYPISRYVLDYVIVERKINIEMDGQYHFSDTKTIEKDIKRDEYLTSNGWKVYRISWTYFSNHKELVLNELIDFMNSEEIICRNYCLSDYSKEESRCECGRIKCKTSTLCKKCNNAKKINRKFEISREELSALVITKPMTEIGKMFGVSDNAVKKRCKKFGIELIPMRGHWTRTRK